MLNRRDFVTGLGTLALTAGCRSRTEHGVVVLRLSHSMTAGRTALHVLADAFREYVEQATSGAVKIRIFPSGTLGQEREVVQQLQEGLVDFMVSGTAIWGSVAPKIQVFDFPFLWRDWDHVHRAIDGGLGREAAGYLERSVRMRPFAWGDSFGFRHVITRSRDVSDPSQLAGLKIRTIQSPIYVKAIELMGASPTPMAFGEVYTSLQTGVIDGFEHAPAVVLTGKYYEVAKYVTLTGHLFGPTVTAMSKKEWDSYTDKEKAVVQAAAKLAQDVNRSLSAQRDRESLDRLREKGMTINPIDKAPFLKAAGPLQDQLAKTLGAEDLLKIIRETK